jgi:protein-tyrosine-phosphatase
VPRPEVGPQCQVLVLCTANQARSPVLAALLRREASSRGCAVQICDAGIEAVPDAPLLETMGEVLRRHGMSVDHRSRPLDVDQVGTDLVLTMTESHRRWVLQRHPRLLPRVFTVRELCRLVSSAQWPSEPPTLADVGPTAHRLRPLVAGRGAEDVEDPAGKGQAVAGRVFEELRECAVVLAPALFDGISEAPPR